MDHEQMIARVADIVLARQHRRDLKAGIPENVAFEVQQTFTDDADLAMLTLAHLLFVYQRLGEQAVRQIRDNARVPAWT
jgi:hypothetical protein